MARAECESTFVPYGGASISLALIHSPLKVAAFSCLAASLRPLECPTVDSWLTRARASSSALRGGGGRRVVMAAPTETHTIAPVAASASERRITVNRRAAEAAHAPGEQQKRRARQAGCIRARDVRRWPRRWRP